MQSNIDPVGAMVTLAGVLLSPALAAVIGPYAVIIIASTVGAAWALGRRDPADRLGAAWYFLRLNATAMLITVPLASFAATWAGTDSESWLLAPIALFVGGVGDDWPHVGRWLLMRLGRLFERRTGGDGGST